MWGMFQLGALFLLQSASGSAEQIEEQEICAGFTAYEADLAKALPLQADSMTEIFSMRINCETKTQSWQKVVGALEDDFAQGWRERKQRQHTQLHCNREGLSRVFGWTVIDQVYDKNMKFLAEFETRPEMCPNDDDR